MPDSSSVAVSPEYQSETMSTPGAKRSTHDPRLENDARRSSRSVAATVSAVGSRAGEESQASSSSLPAATATVTPSSMRPRIAASTFSPAGPLRLRFATAGVPWRWSRAAQSMPAITPEVSPPPSQSRVRTATSATAGATPYVRAADRPGHVRAVPGAVAGAAPVVDRGEAGPHPAAQVAVAVRDAGVDHIGGHARTGPVRRGRRVGPGQRQRPLVDAVEPPRRRRPRVRAGHPVAGADGHVRLDGDDVRPALDPAQPAGRQHGRVAGEHVVVDEPDPGAAGRRVPRGRVGVGSGSEPDDHRRAPGSGAAMAGAVPISITATAVPTVSPTRMVLQVAGESAMPCLPRFRGAVEPAGEERARRGWRPTAAPLHRSGVTPPG